MNRRLKWRILESPFSKISLTASSLLFFFAKLLHAKPKSVSVVAEIRSRRILREKANCKQSKISGHVWTDKGLAQKFANGLQNRFPRHEFCRILAN